MAKKTKKILGAKTEGTVHKTRTIPFLLRAHGLVRAYEGWFLIEVEFLGDQLLPPKVIHGPDTKAICLLKMEAIWSRDE